MNKSKVIIAILSLLCTLLLIDFIRNELNVKVQNPYIDETYNNKEGSYEALVTFDFAGYKHDEVSNVKVVLVDVDNTAQIIDVKTNEKGYQTEKIRIEYQGEKLNSLKRSRPKYLIMWNHKDRVYTTIINGKENLLLRP